ncbi:MAG TPA: hypothetical protein VE152_04130 [Acidimicrobiales bacterium]|nr:hypothetical protein [Acidimicrobiales bacterium]
MTGLDQVVDAFLKAVASHGLDEDLAGEEPARLGRMLAEVLAARLAWDRHVGRVVGVDEARRRLRADSRQAVLRALAEGVLIGWREAGRVVFPEFQFRSRGGTYPALGQVLPVLRSAGMRPKTLASWCNSPQPELEGRTPIFWLRRDRGQEPLLQAARHSAGALAR